MKQKNKARSDAFGGCHPIVNFLYFLFVLGITMFVQHPLILMISFAGALVYAVRLQGAGHVGKNLLMVTLPGLLIITLLNPFLNHYGVTKLLYLEASGNWVTLEALVYGFVLGSVLFIIFTWFSCYNIIMTSDKFIYLFGRLIPAASLILSMVLRFVPRYQRQLEIIRNGQKCAGHDISNAGLINKIKYGMAMLSILVTWALENAIETADSMKSRGYGLPGRSAFSNYTFTGRDKISLLLLGGCGALFLTGASMGSAFAQYNPRILIAGFQIMGYSPESGCPQWLAMLSYFAFAVFCFFPSILGWIQDLHLKAALQAANVHEERTYRYIYETYSRD